MLNTHQFKEASRFIIIAQCLGMLGGALFQNGFYLNYLAARGITSSQIALLLTIPLFVSMLLVIPFAYLSDRVGKKQVSLWGQLLTMAGIFILIPDSKWAALTIAAGFAIMSVGGSLQAGAWAALLSPIIPEKLRGRFFGTLRVIFQLCVVIFSFVISKLLQIEQQMPVFKGILGFVMLATLLRIFVFNRIPELETPHHAPPKHPHLLSALKGVLSDLPFRKFNGYLFLSTLFTASCPMLFGLLEKDVLEFTPARISFMGTLLMIGGMIGCWIGGRLVDRYGAMKIFIGGHIGYALILLTVIFREWMLWSALIHMGIITLIFSLMGGIVGITFSSEMLALMPKDNKSLAGAFSAFAICSAGALVGFAISRILEWKPLLAGWFLLGRNISIYDSLLLASGGAIIAMLILGYFSARKPFPKNTPTH